MYRELVPKVITEDHHHHLAQVEDPKFQTLYTTTDLVDVHYLCRRAEIMLLRAL